MQGPSSEKIKNLFSEISDRYDFANDAITFGIARLWRKHLVRWSQVQNKDQILDIATGTGDLAFDFYNKISNKDLSKVQGIDFCQPMIEIAKSKAVKKKTPIEFSWGDACHLNFDDEKFDIVSISYGIRNVEDPKKALKEMYRVLRPGGRLMILETGSPIKNPLSPLIQFYSHKIVPWIGGIVSGKKEAYCYLSHSSSQFPSGNAFKEFVFNHSDFKACEFKSLMFGASFLYKFLK